MIANIESILRCRCYVPFIRQHSQARLFGNCALEVFEKLGFEMRVGGKNRWLRLSVISTDDRYTGCAHTFHKFIH